MSSYSAECNLYCVILTDNACWVVIPNCSDHKAEKKIKSASRFHFDGQRKKITCGPCKTSEERETPRQSLEYCLNQFKQHSSAHRCWLWLKWDWNREPFPSLMGRHGHKLIITLCFQMWRSMRRKSYAWTTDGSFPRWPQCDWMCKPWFRMQALWTCPALNLCNKLRAIGAGAGKVGGDRSLCGAETHNWRAALGFAGWYKLQGGGRGFTISL